MKKQNIIEIEEVTLEDIETVVDANVPIVIGGVGCGFAVCAGAACGGGCGGALCGF